MHSIYTTVNLNNKKNSFCTTSLHEFLLLHLSVNASLIDIVTFSAFFWTSEANGCFHLEMYFWLVTMVSQQIMASVCFLTHSWRRRWQSSSEKMDGKKGCKAKKMEAYKIIYLSESMQRSYKLSSQRSYRVVKIHADYSTDSL